ncbi:MAG: hypothetical protein ABSG89_11095 [Bacteroidales bacterium]|jgi:membrane associated rhomboid family serine protease
MRSKRYLLIIEIVWIITGLLCVAAGIGYAINTGGSRIFVFGLLAAVSFLFAWLRHRERKKA